MYIVGLVKEEICSYKKKIKFRISGEKMALSIPMHSPGKNRRNN